jgi:hypothetical protein
MLHRIFYMFLLPLEISHDKMLNNFCFLPNIIKVINTRKNIRNERFTFSKTWKLWICLEDNFTITALQAVSSRD